MAPPDLPPVPDTRSTNPEHSLRGIRATAGNLFPKFEDVQDIYATSEINREGNQLGSCPTSTLLNSENSPYGCDETIQTLGQKLWGYQLGTSTSLQAMVLQYLPLPLRHRATRFLPWGDIEALIEQLGEYGLITKEILAVFRALGIKNLNLSNSLASDPINNSRGHPRQVLRVLHMPHSFKDLSSLSLKKVSLHDDDLTYLSSLSALRKLDLSNTGISCEGTSHLVALKDTLSSLNLSKNPNIRHPGSYNLSYLKRLNTLHLTGTNVKMLSLRYLCEKLGSDTDLYLTVPAACKRYLDHIGDKYHNIIPEPYVDVRHLKEIARMPYGELRMNLDFHAQKDSSVSVKGTMDEMTNRLKKLLKRREAELKLRRWVVAT